MKLDWKAVLGIAISALLIWWVLRGVELAEVWAEIQGVRWGLLLAAVVVATSGFLLRALRWKLLLHPLKPDTGLGNRFAAVNIGFAANNLLPARVGEFARAWAISRLEPVTVSGALGSLVVERVLDAIAVFSLLAVALLHPSFPGDATVGGRPISALVLTVVVLLAVVLGTVLLLLLFPRPFLGMADRVARLLPERGGRLLVNGLRSFLGGLTALQNPRLLVGALAWSFAFWGWNAVSFWIAMHAFGIQESYVTALFVQAIIALGVAVPSAPGFFGTFHAAAVVALVEVYGVGENATLAFAFGYHLGGFIPVTVLGLWYAARMGLSMRDLGHAEEDVEEEVEEEGHREVRQDEALEIDEALDSRQGGAASPPGDATSSTDDPANGVPGRFDP
ncbi:lysylphosphatidylglycerol synthase transmembrane domain-containing protein [soil metagenome]